MAELIMVYRKKTNYFSTHMDIVALEPSDNVRNAMAIAAEKHPENIYFFANLDTDV